MPPTPPSRTSAQTPLRTHPYSNQNHRPASASRPQSKGPFTSSASHTSHGTAAPAAHLSPASTSHAASASRIRQVAARFGIANVKPEQVTAILACMDGKDSVVTLPTGFGKSLCFQLVPLLLNGTVIVICPLIALAADQVHSLRARGLAASMFRGRRRLGMNRNGNWKIWKQFKEGKLKFLFMTPEFALSSFRRMFAALPFQERPHIPLLAVDEVHLIEEWAMAGTFRASCRDIGTLRPLLGRVPVMALSATLTLTARENVKRLLEIPEEPNSVLVSVPLNRPEIFISQVDVVNLGTGGWYSELSFLVDMLRRIAFNPLQRDNLDTFPRFVIYTSDKMTLQHIYCWFTHSFAHLRRHFAIYHGSSSRDHRDNIHEGVNANGSQRILGIFATCAFGTGIDMPDLRFVVSIGSPNSHTELVQLLGRCARDGQPGEFIQLVTKLATPKPPKPGTRPPPQPKVEQFHPSRLLRQCASTKRCWRTAYFTDFSGHSSPQLLQPASSTFCCSICNDSHNSPRNDIVDAFIGPISGVQRILAPVASVHSSVRNPHRVTAPTPPLELQPINPSATVSSKNKAVLDPLGDAINMAACQVFNDSLNIEHSINRLSYFPSSAEAALANHLFRHQPVTLDTLRSVAMDCPLELLQSVLPHIQGIAHNFGILLQKWTTVSADSIPQLLTGPQLHPPAKLVPPPSTPLAPSPLGAAQAQAQTPAMRPPPPPHAASQGALTQASRFSGQPSTPFAPASVQSASSATRHDSASDTSFTSPALDLYRARQSAASSPAPLPSAFSPFASTAGNNSQPAQLGQSPSAPRINPLFFPQYLDAFLQSSSRKSS